jgi:hypothetical protein
MLTSFEPSENGCNTSVIYAFNENAHASTSANEIEAFISVLPADLIQIASFYLAYAIE